MNLRTVLMLLPLLTACPGPYAPVPDEDTQLGGNDGGTQEDAGVADAGVTDAGTDAGREADAGLIVQTEQEPNDGAAAAEVNEIQVPAEVTGVIDPAGELDILHFEHAAGEVWTYTLAPRDASSTFSPWLAIGEHANNVPALVSTATAGESARQEHFTLTGGRYNVIIRDLESAGGADVTWRFLAERTPRAPVEVAVPSTTPGTLAFDRAIGLYQFTLTTSTTVRIEVRARGKAMPSDMDPQLSLYDVNQGWVGTNDDPALGNTDSVLEGTLPPGTFIAVIENLEPTASDLSYELVVTTP